jgi:hypothetical protein
LPRHHLSSGRRWTKLSRASFLEVEVEELSGLFNLLVNIKSSISKFALLPVGLALAEQGGAVAHGRLACFTLGGASQLL